MIPVKELLSQPIKLVGITLKSFSIIITISLLGRLPAHAGSAPEQFLGPKLGMAVVFEYSHGGPTTRMIGMGVDEQNRLRVLHETDLLEKGLPHPTQEGEFLKCDYFQQFISAAGKQLIFSDISGKNATVYLDLSKEQWTEHIQLLVGCFESAPEEECPPSPKNKTKVQLRILSRINEYFLDEHREIIKVALDVRTKEFGTLGSSTMYFVSGVGMFSPELPQNARIEYLSDEELRAVDDRFKAQTEEYKKQESIQ